MSTNKEIYEKLTKVNGKEYNTDIPDSNNYQSIDTFASFLSDKHDLKSNEELENEFAESLRTKDKDENNYFDKKHIKDFCSADFHYKDMFDDEHGDDEFNDNYLFLAMNCALRSEDTKNKRGSWEMFHDITERGESQMLNLRLLTNGVNAKGCYITDALKGYEESASDKIIRNFMVKDSHYSFNNPEVNDKQRAEMLYKWDKEALDASEKSKRRKSRKKELGIDSKHSLPKKEKDKISKDVEKLTPVNSEKDDLDIIDENRDIYNKSINVLIHELDVIFPKQVVIFGNREKAPKAKGDSIKGESTTDLVNVIADSPLFRRYEKDPNKGHYHDGSELQKLLKNAISITHYSVQGKNCRDLFNEKKDSIANATPINIKKQLK